MTTVKVLVNNPVDYTEFNYAVIGSFATTTHSTRYILSGYEIYGEQSYDTPSAVFSKHCKEVKFSRKNADERLFDIIFPLYAKPTYLFDAVYVDISKAYLQIANALGNEFIYLGRGHKAYGSSTMKNRYFTENKLLRALLFSGTKREGKKTVWQDNELKEMVFPSQNYAPYLRFGIQAVLHALAQKLKPAIFYWHTDGMILPLSRSKYVFQVLDDYGFEYSIKRAGNVRIYGIGSYLFKGDNTGRIRHTQAYSFRDNFADSDEINPDLWLNIFSRGLSTYKTPISPSF